MCRTNIRTQCRVSNNYCSTHADLAKLFCDFQHSKLIRETNVEFTINLTHVLVVSFPNTPDMMLSPDIGIAE